MNLYKEQLLEHYRNPRNRSVIERPDFSSGVQNPSCGDQVIIAGTIEDDCITQIFFDGQGCVISQASASLLTEYVCGKSCDFVDKLSTQDMRALIGIAVGPTRLKCVMLSLDALQKGVRSAYKKRKEGQSNVGSGEIICTDT